MAVTADPHDGRVAVGGLRLTPYDRVTLVGMTGSGKTYAGRGILAKAKRLIVCDAKGLIRADDWGLVDYKAGMRALQDGQPARVRVPPLDSDSAWEDIFWQIYKLRRVTVYIDELYGVGPSMGSEGLRALYTRGRELGIGMYASTQRPAYVPKYVFSEAGYIFCFTLQLDDDVDTMAKQMGEAVRNPLGWYGFYVYDVRGRRLLRYGKIEYKPGVPASAVREGVSTSV